MKSLKNLSILSRDGRPTATWRRFRVCASHVVLAFDVQFTEGVHTAHEKDFRVTDSSATVATSWLK